MIQYNGIAHSSFPVRRLDDSLAFYCDILNMEIDKSRPDPGYPGTWLEVGKQQIHLLQLENPDPVIDRPQHGGADRHTAIVVTGFDELKNNLVKANVDVSTSKSGRRALFCRDPDGNTLEIITGD